MITGRKLACCTRDMRDMSIDFDEQERIMRYNGLEKCILNSNSLGNESGSSRGDGCVTDSLDEDDSSCSSSTNAFGSFSSLWTIMKKDDEWNFIATSHGILPKEKSNPLPTSTCTSTSSRFSDVETMKEKFAKLLLGDDITGGTKSVSTALALSNAITNLAASVFGELWKLEPLPEERKRKWQREMEWLLAPTSYMVELVPAKQSDANGRTLEIMTPKPRSDIHMNLPALRKLDSMLIETLEEMVNTEFWYDEVGSRAEGRSRSGGEIMRWWLPSPRVPAVGLSEIERKKLLHQGKLVYQVFKAAKSINQNVLAEMPIPTIIRDALPKSGNAELYKILSAESMCTEDMMSCLNLKSEHSALEAINRLEASVVVWKERIAEQGNGKSPLRTSWSFGRDPKSEVESLVNQGELLLLQLKNKYPNLPQTFLDATKIQYGKDVGHSILEAYSRIVGNLAFTILSRLGEILQEDIVSNPNSPAAMSHLIGARIPGISDSPVLDRVRDQLNVSDADAKISLASVTTPSRSRSRVWCIGREACHSLSAHNSP